MIVLIINKTWVIRKHPLLFKLSDIAIINKVDLIDVMDVGIEEMINDAREINPKLKIFTTSATTGSGISEVIDALEL